MNQPVAGPVSSEPSAPSAAGPVAGLFGKLPAHGDFVRRGWPDETVEAVDRWLTETIGAIRAVRDDSDFADWMRAAPLWRGFVPAGQLGPHALHLGVAPSVDRAGRLFPIAAGVAADDAAAWDHAERAGEALDAAIYDALAGQGDADAMVAAIAASVGPGKSGDAPGMSAWWLLPDGAPAVRSDVVDAALLERLLCAGQEGAQT